MKNIKILMILLLMVGWAVADCHTSKLYSYTYTTASGNDIVNLDFSSNTIIFKNATNFNCTNEIGLYNEDTLQINTTSDKTIECYVWDDFVGNISHSSTSLIPDDIAYISDTSLTKLADYYNMSLKKEENITNYDLTNSTLTLSFICDNYETYEKKLSELGTTNFIIGMHEHPLIKITDNNFSRIIQTESDNEDINLLIPQNLSYYKLNFNLKDYTGLFTQSYLIIQRFYDDVPYTIFKYQFPGDLNINDVGLMKNVEYKIVIKTSENTRDYGFITSNENKDVSITITEIPIEYTEKLFENLNFYSYSNYTTQRIYFYYTYSGSGNIRVDWWVYNETEAHTLYHTNSTTNNALFSYLVPDNSTCYLTKYEITSSSGDTSGHKTLCFKSEDKFMQYTTDFDIAGFNFLSLYPMFIIFISLFVAGIGSIYNYSFMGLAVAGIVLLAKYWGWLELPDMVVMSIVVIAILGKLSANRKGVG